MIYRTKRSLIDLYFENEAISQSELKLFEKGIDYYLKNEIEVKKKEKYFEESEDHFKIGSAVDCLLTEGQEVFNQLYYVSTLEKMPSDTMVSIVQMVYDTVRPNEDFVPVLDAYAQQIADACEFHAYQSRWGVEAKFNAVIREGNAYWIVLTESEGKTILTVDEMATIRYVNDTILQHPYLSILLRDAATSETMDVFFQLPVYFKSRIGDIDCKALLDMVIVNHETELITLYDFKTMWDSVVNFPYVVRKRRYDIQAAFYTDAIKKIMANGTIADVISQAYEMEEYNYSVYNYNIEGFHFIVQSTTHRNNAVIFDADSTLIDMGRNGRGELITPAIKVGDESNSFESNKIHAIKGYVDILPRLARFRQNASLQQHPNRISFDWFGEITN